MYLWWCAWIRNEVQSDCIRGGCLIFLSFLLVFLWDFCNCCAILATTIHNYTARSSENTRLSASYFRSAVSQIFARGMNIAKGIGAVCNLWHSYPTQNRLYARCNILLLKNPFTFLLPIGHFAGSLDIGLSPSRPGFIPMSDLWLKEVRWCR
jgi:hypothetical protein